ncbi:hypothetical protein [Amphibacillus xylanus]|uniref:Uncharacterized protein n=1 Tax=Amphibacillus xylanus (strain ATCC 51415 / DSM 6626 / JCM 7361 / LMG 17667 / NBRC 15112 / Ep01) TaxID=698758 RepID=K0J5Y1_AMPXN|nr:hypothetical protein [Amphibacillus xylanus]BAM48501.1 hypothetical protein AXY_23690 [Amphibacillus xylanus NBRC 15112]
MEFMIEQFSNMNLLNQFWISLFLIIPIVLISRTVVAGTRYSPILIVVIFGLTMGYILVETGVAEPGLPSFPMVNLIASSTIIALVVTFFVGGQALRKLLSKDDSEIDELVIPSDEESVLGTTRTQMVMIIRAFFLLIGIEGATRVLIGQSNSALSEVYPLIAYIGIVGAVIFIDNRATIKNKPLYIRKGIIEIIAIILVLYLSSLISQWISPIIALPQIFFTMVLSSLTGALLYRWSLGPTIKALLFAGIPVVLAGNFMVGGSRMGEAFSVEGMSAVLAYGFFGQLLFMFGGIALMMFLGKTNHIRNLAPSAAGALSHSGLTGAATAGDLGSEAQRRTPIMVNMPFFGHIFVFSILAISSERGSLWMWPSVLVVVIGLVLTLISMKTLRKSNGDDAQEVKALMQFSFGWQVVAVFGGLLLLTLGSLPLDYAGMGTTSSLSHFGLFAATQGGLFGAEAAHLIPFIFSMPFLVHPVVFFMFGKAMKDNGRMPEKTVYAITAVGIIGVLISAFVL